MVEKNLIRADLYLADEVFIGTAAEVTPIRSVDDQEIGVGPVTQELQQAYLDTVRGRERRWAHWLDTRRRTPRARGVTHRPGVPLSAPWLDERDEELVLEVLRSGRLSLGPTVRASRSCSPNASARLLRGRVERHRRAPPLHAARRASAPATR